MQRLGFVRIPLAFALALGALIAFRGPLDAQGTRLLRQPAVSADHIAFVHANDIWIVGREGGQARRLTTDVGGESEPAFSPDGQWLAFTGQYGGNQDVYIVATTGGQPTRLTWHPGGDVVQGWTPDGDVIFRSGRAGAPTRLWQFFTVPVSGGLPVSLGVPQAWLGEMSADGQWLAYQEIGYWDPEWRNYRGGQAQPVSVVSLDTFERITPPWEGERHMDPTWMDGVVYYMSERDWASNVWAFDPSSGQETQISFHADFDVKSLDAGFGVVVYEKGGYLHEVTPATGQSRQLEIFAEGDQNWARPRWEAVSSNQLTNARLSPTGKRALFQNRGELFSVPAEEGSWRNITRTPGVADRHAVWSPDGSQIAWFNDEGGEYGLMIADQDGANPRRIEISDPTHYFIPEWSPDGTRLAFTDTDYRVLIVDVASGALTHVDTEPIAHPERSMNPVWSPDSRWLAYSRRMDNQLRAVFVYDTEAGQVHQLTDGMADAISPVWDADGKYLYFLGSTNFGLNTGWLDMTSYDRPVTRALYVVLLGADEPSPFLPVSDEEKGDDADAEKSEGGDDEVAVVIDFDGIHQRTLDAPGLPMRNYVGLLNGPAGMVFVAEPVPNQPGTTLQRYNLEDQEAEAFLERVVGATASHDRKKILYRSGSNWSIVDAGGRKPAASDGRLALGNLRVQVDPRAEWAQMLRDGWRFMRDFLYVDNAHGAPWEDVWTWYEPWLEGVEHRSDFNHLLDMVSGEIAVGHSYVRGGDYPDITNPRTGLLGADIYQDGDYYRLGRIYSGEEWTPGLMGPLSHPGMNVSEGDYILAIDGQTVRAPANPYQLLEGTAGRTITLTVNSSPSMEGARDIITEPTGNEGQLRTWAWVADNQKRVDEMSGGKLAYVWLPNTGQPGYTYFNRMYFAQQDRQGAVIDERNNGGGSAADYIVDILARNLTGYFNSRVEGNRPFTQPIAGLWGPKVMVINERAGSGGDLLPYLFRFQGVGPLVGARTWGGLVGTWDTPVLLDGGRFVAPRGGFYNVDGEWDIEGLGIAPDIEVRNDPKPVMEGGDPQLEAAIMEALRLLETEGVELMPEPAPPIRWRRPVGWENQVPRRPGGGN